MHNTPYLFQAHTEKPHAAHWKQLHTCLLCCLQHLSLWMERMVWQVPMKLEDLHCRRCWA